MKIATYNVNSIRSRLHIVLPWLKNHQPDIFCMQETKVEDAKFPLSEFEAAGYTVTFRGGKQYNGVAIASKRKPQKVSFGLADDPPDPDRLAAAHFGDLVILTSRPSRLTFTIPNVFWDMSLSIRRSGRRTKMF